MPTPTLDELRAAGLTAGLDAVGHTSADPFPEVRAVLEERRAKGLHATMAFTYRNPARSTEPAATLPDARTLIVAARSYHRAEPPRPPGPGPYARTARYVWADDQERLLAGLESIADALRNAGYRAVVVSDQNNLVDRAVAHRAGLGWYGKNANLLLPGVGSWFLLGAVVTDAVVTDAVVTDRGPDASVDAPRSGVLTDRDQDATIEAPPPDPGTRRGLDASDGASPSALVTDRGPDAPVGASRRQPVTDGGPDASGGALGPRPDPPVVPDGCGSCARCLPACPTGALVAPGVLDARRCLSWTLQATGVFPVDQRVALGDRIYGCDDCQDVCPPNRVELRRRGPDGTGKPARVGSPERAWVDVLALLAATDEELLARHGRWYIARRQPRYLRRNALVVLGNVGDGTDPATCETLARALVDDDPLVRAHAVWSARRLGCDDLVMAARDDLDPDVHAELAREVPRRDRRAPVHQSATVGPTS